MTDTHHVTAAAGLQGTYSPSPRAYIRFGCPPLHHEDRYLSLHSPGHRQDEFTMSLFSSTVTEITISDMAGTVNLYVLLEGLIPQNYAYIFMSHLEQQQLVHCDGQL